MRPRLDKLGIFKANPDDLTASEIERFVRLDIDPDSITWKRVTDTNDRYLRGVSVGTSPSEVNKKTGESLGRESGFAITVASEIMAVLALATDLSDLRARLGRMIACTSRAGEPLTADDFGITGALTVLMMDALMPTTMQTLEGTPALVHCGPFANIAHGALASRRRPRSRRESSTSPPHASRTGNSSVVADRLALKLVGPQGYVLTEAGFGSDMGGEKFFNIKCLYSKLRPSCAVLVCTVRALKLHSNEAPPVVPGAALAAEYREERLGLVAKGAANMLAHIQNVRKHGVQVAAASHKNTTPGPKTHEHRQSRRERQQRQPEVSAGPPGRRMR